MQFTAFPPEFKKCEFDLRWYLYYSRLTRNELHCLLQGEHCSGHSWLHSAHLIGSFDLIRNACLPELRRCRFDSLRYLLLIQRTLHKFLSYNTESLEKLRLDYICVVKGYLICVQDQSFYLGSFSIMPVCGEMRRIHFKWHLNTYCIRGKRQGKDLLRKF